MGMVNLSRRGFLGAGAGLVIGFTLSGFRALPPTDNTVVLGASSDAEGHALNAWILISEAGVVTLRMAAAEMGQGVSTALPMILAEELCVDWQSVRVESAATNKVFRRSNVEYPGKVQLTGGSLSVRGYYTELREAGAAARAMLVAAAAARWSCDTESCRTEAGYVICEEQRATYGELAVEAALRDPPKHPTLKDPASFKLLGTSPPRLDIPSKTNGSARFGIDVVVDGMLYATIVPCPHYGGRLSTLDDAAARKVPGVLDVFPVDGQEVVAVVAKDTWSALQGALALQVSWDPGAGKGLDDARIGELLKAALDQGKPVERRGHTPKGFTLEATYEVPYLDHAPIEPLNATAWVQADRVDIWAPTQAQQIVAGQAARLTGVSKDQVFIHPTFLGGGFGRKSFWDYTNQAVLISRHVGAPVKLTWTREACFARGFYRPRVLCRFRAALGRDGLPTDWHASIASQSLLAQFVPKLMLGLKVATSTATDGVSDMPYAVPNVAVDYGRVDLPIGVGWWRSVQGSHNAFFRESFLDECAAAAGQDPIEYRRKLLRDSPRALRCFELAVERAGPVPAGLHRGVALFHCFGSTVAEIADVSVTDGTLKVRGVTAAVDCGTVIHPDTLHAQIQSAVGMGLSSMYEGLTFVDGAAQQPNYYAYPLLHLADMPEVAVHIVPSTEPPGGIGEVGLPPILGAVGNAIFAATGKRVRSLPISQPLA